MSQEPKFILHETVISAAIGDDVEQRGIKAEDKSGTTLTMTVIAPKFYVVCNIGDSRTIIVENKQVVFSTLDHSVKEMSKNVETWSKELNRIKLAGGNIEQGRLYKSKISKESLGMTRALGDFDYKYGIDPQNHSIQLFDPKVLSAEPDLYDFYCSTKTEQYIIMASDGIWNCMSNSDCAAHFGLYKNEYPNRLFSKSLNEICENICLKCLASNDNISLIVVCLLPLDSFNGNHPVAVSRNPASSIIRNLTSEFEDAGIKDVPLV